MLLYARLVGTPPDSVRRPELADRLTPLADTTVVQLMRFVPRPIPPTVPPPGPRAPTPRRLPETPEPEVAVVPEPPRPETPPAPEPPTATPPTRGRGLPGGLKPQLGAGALWVRPLPLPPAELAARLQRGQSHVALVDSAVDAIIQRYLDSLALDPEVNRSPVPAWVGRIGGKEFGLDGRNVIIGGLRIPAVILGFLPFSLPARADVNREAPRARDMRDDLLRAVRRAENYEAFKDAIREIRERKQAERDFVRNQRQAPPVPTDSGETTQ